MSGSQFFDTDCLAKPFIWARRYSWPIDMRLVNTFDLIEISDAFQLLQINAN